MLAILFKIVIKTYIIKLQLKVMIFLLGDERTGSDTSFCVSIELFGVQGTDKACILSPNVDDVKRSSLFCPTDNAEN
jgi:hypothetical protein